MLCGKGMEWYIANKERFNIRGYTRTSDLTNDYGNTNIWNERADKRKDHEEGLRYNYNTDLMSEGSRAFESNYPMWKPTHDRNAWRDAAYYKSCIGDEISGNGLDADTVDKYLLKINAPSANHYWSY